MRKYLMVLAIMAAPSLALAAGADGVWQTEANDAGGYLEVTIAPCATDVSKTCGIVSKAFKGPGAEDPAYRYLGKAIVENMASEGDGRYSGGTVFDPESGKTFKSKMALSGQQLDVEGCVLFFCKGQNWRRVQ